MDFMDAWIYMLLAITVTLVVALFLLPTPARADCLPNLSKPCPYLPPTKVTAASLAMTSSSDAADPTWIEVTNTGTANFVLTLPSAPIFFHVYRFTDVTGNAATYNIVLTPPASPAGVTPLINGTTTVSITTNSASILAWYDGAAWWAH